MPFCLPGWGGNPRCFKAFHDHSGAFPFKVAAVDGANHLSFLWHYFRSILSLPVPQEMAVGQGDLPLRKTLPHAPGDVLTY